MDLDVEYNNRARVPEHPEIMEGWQRDAATFRKAARAELDVPYGPSERMKLDLFLPDNDAPQAAAMFIHGGYWQSLDKSYASHLARGLTQHGFAVCVPGYDLCPHVSMTDIVDEIAHACIWTVRLLQMPLVITGHSAGGHLAACMLARDWSALSALSQFRQPMRFRDCSICRLSCTLASTRRSAWMRRKPKSSARCTGPRRNANV